MTVFYYTATGNSLYVAPKIGSEVKSIPQELKSTNLHYDDGIIGIVYPCYVYGMPVSVERFLEKATFKAQYTFAVITYGFARGASVTYLKNAMNKYGKNFDYINHIKMVDNYLLTFDMEREVSNEEKKKVDKNLGCIITDINSQMYNTPNLGVMGKFFEIYGKTYKSIYATGEFSNKYDINNKCIRCGICAKVCPTGNISVKHSVLFNNKCEGCMACIHACPQNAIHLGGEKSHSRYRNKNISLQEIIVSNKQI